MYDAKTNIIQNSEIIIIILDALKNGPVPNSIPIYDGIVELITSRIENSIAIYLGTVVSINTCYFNNFMRFSRWSLLLYFSIFFIVFFDNAVR